MNIQYDVIRYACGHTYHAGDMMLNTSLCFLYTFIFTRVHSWDSVGRILVQLLEFVVLAALPNLAVEF